jgi:hypothetical protein
VAVSPRAQARLHLPGRPGLASFRAAR